MPMSLRVSCVRSSSTSPVMSLSIIGSKKKKGKWLGWGVATTGSVLGVNKKRREH